jgi:hypothetical protein
MVECAGRGLARKLLEEADPRLIEDLERIVAPTQRGDPEQPLRWTIKSLRQIARALRDLGCCTAPKLLSVDLPPVKPRAHVGRQIGPIAPAVAHLHDVGHGRSLNLSSTLTHAPPGTYDLHQRRFTPLDTHDPPWWAEYRSRYLKRSNSSCCASISCTRC